MTVDVNDIEQAAIRLVDVSVRTPIIESAQLSVRAGGEVLLKPECLQVTGSFKIRGAYNRLRQLTAKQARNGVVAWSSGNHAQGVAAAGRLLGIQTTIVMPEDAPRAKLNNTRRLGGEVIAYDRCNGDREAIATAIAAQRQAALVPSYDHEHVIAGQGTVGLELADDALAAGRKLDQVLIPCGGGGLSCGSALALRSRYPHVDVYAVEPVAFNDTEISMAKGQRTGIDAGEVSICDALQTLIPGAKTFALNQALLSGVLTVTDAQVRAAIRFAFMNLKLVLEPGGAVALAAILAEKLDTRGKTTAIVLSGGNIDRDLFAEIQAEPN